MGLAISQVRLLALTARKADVELEMELDSNRKTMLTRQSTQLSQEYYSKLQNSTIQYSTTNGYTDVDYSYLMANNSSDFFNQVLTGNGSAPQKASSGMILTDMYGRVVLDNSMMNVYTSAMNDTQGKGTVEDKTLTAISELFKTYQTNLVSSTFSDLYNSKTASGNDPQSGLPQKLGYSVLQKLLENGYQQGGAIYKGSDGSYYSSRTSASSLVSADKVTLSDGTFYQVQDSSGNYLNGDVDYQMCVIDGSSASFYPNLSSAYAKEIANVLSYYGSIFSAAFNNGVSGKFNEDVSKISASTPYKMVSNTDYTNASQDATLQAGLKSGVFQLVNVESPSTGHYSKAQNLDYFISENYVAQNTDESKKEEITAWYNAQKADLDNKESYWDTEVTQLSTELNSITTEMDSVKSLRDNAISSVFKWGSSA